MELCNGSKTFILKAKKSDVKLWSDTIEKLSKHFITLKKIELGDKFEQEPKNKKVK